MTELPTALAPWKVTKLAPQIRTRRGRVYATVGSSRRKPIGGKGQQGVTPSGRASLTTAQRIKHEAGLCVAPQCKAHPNLNPKTGSAFWLCIAHARLRTG